MSLLGLEEARKKVKQPQKREFVWPEFKPAQTPTPPALALPTIPAIPAPPPDLWQTSAPAQQKVPTAQDIAGQLLARPQVPSEIGRYAEADIIRPPVPKPDIVTGAAPVVKQPLVTPGIAPEIERYVQPDIIGKPVDVTTMAAPKPKEATIMDKIRQVAEAVPRGAAKTFAYPEIARKVWEPYMKDLPEDIQKQITRSLEVLERKPESASEQITEIVGRVIPYFAFSPIKEIVTGLGMKALAKHAPGFAMTVIGKALPSIAGTAALGATVAATREGAKVATGVADIEQAAKEIASEAGRFALFGAAGEFAGMPARTGVLKALSNSVRTGKISSDLANIISAASGGAATGFSMASAETALHYLKNPKEFDKAQAKNDIITTTLFFAGLDTLFALASMGRGFTMGGTEKGTPPYKNAIHSTEFKPTENIFVSGTRNPAQEGFREFKSGMGVWMKGDKTLYEMVVVGDWYVPKYETVKGTVFRTKPAEAPKEATKTEGVRLLGQPAVTMPAPISAEAGKEAGKVEVPAVTPGKPVVEANKTYTIYRRDVKDAVMQPESKPHGLYVSLVKDETFKSPHMDVGDTDYKGTITPKNPLIAEEIHVKHERFKPFSGGPASAGVSALKILKPDEFDTLLKMSKGDLIKRLEKEFPGPDYSKYYDAYELLEAYATQLARKQGYDAIVLEDKTMPEFSEVVVLSNEIIDIKPEVKAEAKPEPEKPAEAEAPKPEAKPTPEAPKAEKIDAYTERMAVSPETGEERPIRTEYRIRKLTTADREILYKDYKDIFGKEYVVEQRTTKDGTSTEWRPLDFHKNKETAIKQVAETQKIIPVSEDIKKAIEAEKAVQEAEQKKLAEAKRASEEKEAQYKALVDHIAEEYPLNKLKRKAIKARMEMKEESTITPPFSAYKVSDRLYVHKAIDPKTMKPSLKKDAKWTLTIDPIGIAVKSYNTPQEAIAAAVALDRSGIELGETLDAVKKQAKDIVKVIKDFEAGVMPGEEDPLTKIKTEMGEKVDRVVGDVNIPIGQTIKIVNVSPDAKGMFSSADPEIDARVKAAHGVKSPGTFSKIEELMDSLVRKATREYEYLPGGKEFARARFDLLRLSKQKGVAADETLRLIQGIIIDFKDNPKAYNHFEWKVLLNDLAEEAKAGRDLPFGYTKEKLETDLKRLDEALEKYPQVLEAIKEREKVWKAIIKAYVEAQEAIGFKVEDKFTKRDYFRHMVLEYANTRSPYGTGKKLRTPTGRGFLKQRKGTELDINSNYLEAEYEVMAQMLYDIENARVIKNIDTDYNIVDQLKAKAVEINDERIMKFFAKMAAQLEKEIAPESLYRQILNWQQAKGFEAVGKLASEGFLPDKNGKYAELILELADNYLVNKKIKAEKGRDWTIQDAKPLPEWAMKELFQYAAWVMKSSEAAAGVAKGAFATIFKGIAEKKRYIKETLSHEYVTWKDLVPEGYVPWQPREGNVFYFADSIPSQLAQKLLTEGLKEIGVSENDIRKVLAKGQKFPEMVIKEELAKTLDNLTRERPVDPIKKSLRDIMKGWKIYQLTSPKRWAKFNFRNISGDAEAVFVGNPSTFKKVPQATKELYRVFVGDGAMTKDMRDWFERGGMQSLLQTQEIGDVNNLRMFVDLMEKKGKITEILTKIWQGYWKAARLSTDYREAILRYAAYLDYLEQLKANNGRPKNFGASKPEEVMALRSNEDKAYWLSNDLLGAYDKVSVIGQELRESLIPFWSWKEVNFKRYIQFIKNAARDDRVAETVGRIALGTLKRSPFIAFRVGMFLIKAIGLWAALDIFNKKFFPEEEFELPADVRNTPHIVLGRDKNGKVRYFSRLGMLSDFLEWFGLEEAPGLVSDFLNGKKNLKEIAAEMAKGPVNALVQGVGPQYKIPAELIMGRKVFPDAFEPGMIRDRGYYIAQSLGLADEYSILMKLPRRPYKEKLTTFLVYEQDPGQGAYYDILDMKREFQKKIGKPTGFMSEVSPKSQALYNLKLAIRYQDKEAFDRYAAEYINYGGTADGLKTSLRNMHPLHGLNDAEKKAFVKQLTEADRKRLELAIRFYEEVLLAEKRRGRVLTRPL